MLSEKVLKNELAQLERLLLFANNTQAEGINNPTIEAIKTNLMISISTLKFVLEIEEENEQL